MYRMQAEWDRHAATWLAWPHNKEDWPDRFGPIPFVYGDIIRNLAQVERVRLVVRNEKEEAAARELLERCDADLDKVDFFTIPTDRIWLRDSGPIFVKKVNGGSWRVEGEKKKNASPTTNHQPPTTLLDWRFNAWAKYDNHKKDDKVPQRIFEQRHRLNRAGDSKAIQLDSPRIRSANPGNDGYEIVQPIHKNKRVVLEGGSIDVNGKGTLLTTEECLLSKIQCRNPGFSREDYEAVFEKYLGISQIIWLGDGIVGDDTHGHVDDLARFVNANTVVVVSEKDKGDDNFALLKDNVKRLKKARDQNGKQLTIVELPMPKAIIFEGQRLPASYANFLIANGLVLVPTFNDPADRVALNILAELMPKHEIVGIHCLDFIWGLGTIHCMSQQEPL